MNSDWTLKKILLNRYNFTTSNQNLIKLVELTLCEKVDSEEYFYSKFLEILKEENLGFKLSDVDEYNKKVYELIILEDNLEN